MWRAIHGLFFLLLPLSGCANLGTTVVDYKVNMKVSYHHLDGSEKQLTAGILTELPRDPRKLLAFPDLQYQDTFLLWKISVSTLRIGFEVTNLSGKDLVMHWEAAELASNQQAQSIPLRSYLSNVAGSYLGSNGFVPKYEDRLHALVTLSLSPEQKSNVRFGAHYAQVFASGRLFGARYKAGETRLQESGIGNWLRISVPITMGEENLLMQITLTAVDAKARTSYY